MIDWATTAMAADWPGYQAECAAQLPRLPVAEAPPAAAVAESTVDVWTPTDVLGARPADPPSVVVGVLYRDPRVPTMFKLSLEGAAPETAFLLDGRGPVTTFCCPPVEAPYGGPFAVSGAADNPWGLDRDAALVAASVASWHDSTGVPVSCVRELREAWPAPIEDSVRDAVARGAALHREGDVRVVPTWLAASGTLRVTLVWRLATGPIASRCAAKAPSSCPESTRAGTVSVDRYDYRAGQLVAHTAFSPMPTTLRYERSGLVGAVGWPSDVP